MSSKRLGMANTLSGTSEIVGGDPYELRVVALPVSKGWKAALAKITADGRAEDTVVMLAQSGPYVLRLRFDRQRAGL